MDKADIERINQLARKKKAEGLTEEELNEQARLRLQYLKELRESMQATLDQVYIENEDGEYEKLQKKEL